MMSRSSKRKGPSSSWEARRNHLSKTMVHSQVEVCEPCANRFADHVTDVLGYIPARPPGPLPVLLGHEVAEVGQPGGDGEPDAVDEGRDGGQGPAHEGVQREDYAAEGQEERGDGLAQRVCPDLGGRSQQTAGSRGGTAAGRCEGGGAHDGCVSVNLRNPSFRSDLPPVLPAWLKIPFALPTMHVTLQGWPSSSTSWVSLPSEDRTERASRRTSVRLWKSGPTWRASFLALSPEMGSGC